MWGNPNQYGNMPGDGGELFGIATALGCVAIFTLLLMVLYLWLFYRIFQKAGYSGWYTLLNLVPYIGSVIVVFMLAFGDWPILRNRGYGQGGYGPPYPPGGPSGYTGYQAPPSAPPVGPPVEYPPTAGEQQDTYGSEPPAAP